MSKWVKFSDDNPSLYSVHDVKTNEGKIFPMFLAWSETVEDYVLTVWQTHGEQLEHNKVFKLDEVQEWLKEKIIPKVR